MTSKDEAKEIARLIGELQGVMRQMARPGECFYCDDPIAGPVAVDLQGDMACLKCVLSITDEERPYLFSEDAVLTVPLTQGQVMMVDLTDADLIDLYSWSADRSKHARSWYARGRAGGKLVRLHTLIAKRIGIDGEADHIDNDGLNNRRSNLRLASRAEQAHNRRKRSDNSSGYIGVRQLKSGRWRAIIFVSSGEEKPKGIHLGMFDTAEDAARAYDAAAYERSPEFSTLNFPEEYQK